MAVSVVPAIVEAEDAPIVVPSIAPAFISTVANVAVPAVQKLEAFTVVSSQVKLAEPPKVEPPSLN